MLLGIPGLAAVGLGHVHGGMGPLHRTGSLVRRPVVMRGVRVGVAVEALFDRTLTRLVGFEVRCGDGAHRFLPFPASEVRNDGLVLESALVLLDRELGFYRGGGSVFSTLRGQDVTLAGDLVGPLADVLVDREGSVRAIGVSTPEGMRELEPRPGLVVGNHLLRPAV
jgi:hypothetical protein